MSDLPLSVDNRGYPSWEMRSIENDGQYFLGKMQVAACGRAAPDHVVTKVSSGSLDGLEGQGETGKTGGPAADGSSSSHLEIPSGPEQTKPLRRILIVDDDANVALTLQAGLETLPHCQVVVASSGKYAVQLFEAEPFELLITDYKMPGADGMTLAKYVREIYPQTTIVLITAYSSDELREQAAGASVYCVLDKPVGLAEVRKLVMEVLERSSGEL